jgi:DNA-binding beta-propeller fold protein YncE
MLCTQLKNCRTSSGLKTGNFWGLFAYVANFYSNLVSAYSIGSDGTLTPLPGPFGEDAAVGPISVAVDSAAKFAYVANYASNKG